MKNESVKKSLEKSNNVLEKSAKPVKQKNCIKKTNTFKLIPMNFVQEQLKRFFKQKGWGVSREPSLQAS